MDYLSKLFCNAMIVFSSIPLLFFICAFNYNGTIRFRNICKEIFENVPVIKTMFLFHAYASTYHQQASETESI